MNRLANAVLPVCWGLQAVGIVVASVPWVAGALAVTALLGAASIGYDLPGWIVAVPCWVALAGIAWRERRWPERRDV